MKNSGVEWIGEIPDGWEVSKIGQLYEERRIKVSDTIYPPLSVTMQGILPQLETAAKSDAHDDRKLVFKGDFAINSRSDRRGSCGISEFDGSVSLINTVLHPKTEMNPIYYNWLFHSFRFSDEYYKNGHGIVDDLWTTSWSEMKRIFIPLPPKSTQQRIASYLDKKCSKIEETIQNQQQVIEKLKAYKQSLITEAVTGKIKIQNGKVCGKYESYKDSGVEWIGKIPSEWILSKFKFISKEIGDGLHGTPTFDESGDIYFLNGTNIGKEKLFFKDDTDRINSLEYEKYKHPLLSKYTIFIALNGATYGKTSFYNNEKVLLGKSAGYITFDKKQNILFIRYYLQSYAAKKIEEISLLGSTIQNLSLYTLNNFPVPLPSEIETNSIVEYLDKKCTAIDTAIEQKQNLIEKLTEYKKSLIYECVTGKKEIS
jgi:type I restriction enzyme S subunit